jgi:hypothetical protein
MVAPNAVTSSVNVWFQVVYDQLRLRSAEETSLFGPEGDILWPRKYGEADIQNRVIACFHRSEGLPMPAVVGLRQHSDFHLAPKPEGCACVIDLDVVVGHGIAISHRTDELHFVCQAQRQVTASDRLRGLS